MNKTTEELFEELSTHQWKMEQVKVTGYLDLIDALENKKEKLISQITKQIQSDLLKEVLGLTMSNNMVHSEDIKSLAESKGITDLK